jgi:biopolymer transport protein ExbB
MLSTLIPVDTVHKVLDSASKALSVNPSISSPEKLNFLDLLMKGGFVMLPIALLFFIGIFIFIERFLALRVAGRSDNNLLFAIRQNMVSGNIESAISICRKTNSPISRMLNKGLMRVGKPIKEIEGAIENTGKIEVSKLEKNISVLGIIAGISPMLGFVGTIVGVIKIFYNISLADNISIGLVADGLYQKMITSASGLLVGILAYLGHHILNMMLDRVVLKMETESIDFIDLLEEPVRY